PTDETEYPPDQEDREMTTSTSRPHHIPYSEISRKLVADSARPSSAGGTGKLAAQIRRSIRSFGHPIARRRPDSA
ncbi:MAG: hypothetical protein ACREVN_06760, partial [Gammaproteobacteria bacterium]